ncbi:LacI family gluconate utilization system Gnt-I transcriptional repressor [Inquilinus ginsengisoli]|uniref:LacI family DNA-binding transcriptional regulator n=1 Tax=Inquilinus ginsengisoli TaxID=363840 RepID=UPI003D1E917A
MARTRRLDPKGITLADIARTAGVSKITVSRVLRGGPVAAETRERVLEIVRRLGYVPNRLAGTLSSAGSNLVGVIIPSLANIVFPDVLRGAEAVLDAAGFRPVVGVTDYDPAREEGLIEAMLAWRPAGLIVTGLEHTDRSRAMLANAGIRVAELMDLDGAGLDIVVGLSNRAAGRASARHLIERGYRRLAYVGHDLSQDRRAAKRFEGFREALSESPAALVATEILPGRSSAASGREGLARILDRGEGADRVDAVYFSNDDMAMGGCFLCLSRGIAVPDQVALFGFNGLDLGQALPQPLSTIRSPRVRMGEVGARLVCGREPPVVVDLGFELIPGATA